MSQRIYDHATLSLERLDRHLSNAPRILMHICSQTVPLRKESGPPGGGGGGGGGDGPPSTSEENCSTESRSPFTMA